MKNKKRIIIIIAIIVLVIAITIGSVILVKTISKEKNRIDLDSEEIVQIDEGAIEDLNEINIQDSTDILTDEELDNFGKK